MRKAAKKLLVAVFVVSLVSGASGQGRFPVPPMTEKSDGAPAVAEKKDDHEVDFVVVPGPTYSPSLGWGIMLIPVATFLYDPADRVSPVSSMTAFLLLTQNGSYVAGIGPKLYLAGDTWRLSGSAGYGNVKQNFFGIGATDPDEYVSMTNEVVIAQGQALYRVWPSFFFGPQVQYRQARFRAEDPDDDPALEASGLNYDYNHNVIAGVVAHLDTREDQVAPRAGMFVDMNLRYSNESLGSTSTYERLGVAWSQYLTMWKNPRHVFAWMATVETGFGEVPFDEYPDLGAMKALRGYVKGEFTDKNMVAVQAEYRWNAWKRLGLTPFFGVGKVFPEWDEIDEVSWLPAGGLGLRYLVIPKRRMNARLDFAWGKLGFNYYFSVGEAF